MRRIWLAEVTVPNAALPTCVFGLPQFTTLKRLKISARSCRRDRPAIATFFINDRLVTFDPGPRSELRGALPKVKLSGSAKADGSKQFTNPTPFGSGWQFSEGLPLTFGR